MKTQLIILLAAGIFFSGCEIHMGPSSFLERVLKIQSDSGYYQGKVRNLVSKISGKIEEYEINKIAVIDMVNEEGKVPILGEYLASRIVEIVAQKRNFRVAQKGELQEVMEQLGLEPALYFSKKKTEELGSSLNAQAVLHGRIADLGTNLDVQTTLVDVVTGEVIASATETLNRTKFAVEMLRHF